MTSLAHLFQQQVVQEVSMCSDALILLWKNGSNSNTYDRSISVELTNQMAALIWLTMGLTLKCPSLSPHIIKWHCFTCLLFEIYFSQCKTSKNIDISCLNLVLTTQSDFLGFWPKHFSSLASVNTVVALRMNMITAFYFEWINKTEVLIKVGIL